MGIKYLAGRVYIYSFLSNTPQILPTSNPNSTIIAEETSTKKVTNTVIEDSKSPNEGSSYSR